MKKSAAAGLILGAISTAFGQDYNGGAYCPPLGPGPDVTLCEVYSFDSTVRVAGGVYSGVASNLRVGTTSWNVGTAQLLWEQSPDPDHPKITMTVYRLLDGRFENIANHWIKHGFFALSETQCVDTALGGNGLCVGTNGTRLGLRCTDTYDPGLNDGPTLGPRYEVNPWTGAWSYSGSIFQTGGSPTYGGAKQLQLADDDLSNSNARYFVEAYYVTSDDICIYNSASYKEVTLTGFLADGRPTFTSSSRFTPPEQVFAMLEAWDGATITEVAEDMPPVKGVSPDGRAFVGAHVTDLGGGEWRYDYTVFNADMDRQIDQFWVDLPENVTVDENSLYFHAPMSHEETLTYEFGAIQGPPRDNTPWTGAVESDKVRWSTPAHQAGVASNPIGWGSAYSFGFTADTPPTTGTMALTAYKPGAAGPIAGATQAPTAGVAPCPGDVNNDGVVDLDDLSTILFAFGAPYDLDDLSTTLFNFGNACW
jgi:hypothetical protein